MWIEVCMINGKTDKICIKEIFQLEDYRQHGVNLKIAKSEMINKCRGLHSERYVSLHICIKSLNT